MTLRALTKNLNDARISEAGLKIPQLLLGCTITHSTIFLSFKIDMYFHITIHICCDGGIFTEEGIAKIPYRLQNRTLWQP